MIDPQRTSHAEPTFRDCGDTALLVDFGAAQDRLLASRIYDLSQKLTARNLAGFSECVPAFSTLTVYYDPLQIERHAIENEVLALWRKAAAGGFKRRRWIVPACYGGARGEDLQSVSELANLSSKQVIEIHSST